MLINLPVRDFCDKLAQKDAPGGGSGAALVGLTGISLLEMAVLVSLGEAGQETELGLQAELKKVHRDLETFIDLDAEILAQVLPALTEVGPDGNLEEWNGILLKAADVPLGIAQCCRHGLELALKLLDTLKPNVVCDANVGAMSLHTALQSAVLLAKLNISLLRDHEGIAAELQERCESEAAQGEELIDKILAAARL